MVIINQMIGGEKKMFKNKLLWLSPVIALLVILFFINIISNRSTSAENLPIAVVNEDQGRNSESTEDEHGANDC